MPEVALPRTGVGELGERVGQRVRVCGWVDGVVDALDRGGGTVVVLRDRTGVARVVVPEGVAAPAPEEAVTAEGTVAEDGGNGDGTTATVVADRLTVVGPVLDRLPLDERSPLELRMDWRFLDLRRRRNLLVFEVQTTAERAMRACWEEDGFIELHTPKLRPNPNRTGRELFSLRYFDRQAYLAQSPQFYKQMAMAAGFERVFEIGPVFRANPLVTSRHDTEFTSVDVELSWVDSHEDVMAYEERWLQRVIEAVRDRHGHDVARLYGVEVKVPSVPFPRIPLDEARRIVESSGGGGGAGGGGGRRGPAQPPGDLDADGERALGRYVAAGLGSDFVFVTNYPGSTRPFYHMRVDDSSPLTRGFDLLWKGMEVTTGAQREHRYDRLVAQAEDQGVPLDPIRYYLECFRFGCPPHGGFGLGLTRMLMCLLGVDDVREVTYLHRGRYRLSP